MSRSGSGVAGSATQHRGPYRRRRPVGSRRSHHALAYTARPRSPAGPRQALRPEAPGDRTWTRGPQAADPNALWIAATTLLLPACNRRGGAAAASLRLRGPHLRSLGHAVPLSGDPKSVV